MKPSDETIDNAVMRIFRDNLVTRVGGRLSLDSLREDWVPARLRRDDLDDGLTRLIQRGLLRFVDTDEGPHFELTEQGARFITEIPHQAKSLLHRLGSALQLSGANHRRPSPPDAPHNRRRNDPKA